MNDEQKTTDVEQDVNTGADADGGETAGENGTGETAAGSEAEQEAGDFKQKAGEYYAALQRLKAEFDNFRKRTQKEKEELVKYGTERLILKLLPVADNLGRALEASAQTQDFSSLCQGLDMICKQLGKVLEDEGVTPIEAVGLPFDPNLHEALLREESEAAENTILAELEKGYYLKGKVVRPSRVKVSA
ncbi:MAG: nucleotide exchange factor GrpE [Gracilibacteraceae bacterium]|jgi:molecular chaperone GrpE|nr:nucleotide exchange factor GrpE [Gracilibacteraceae bacterium]